MNPRSPIPSLAAAILLLASALALALALASASAFRVEGAVLEGGGVSSSTSIGVASTVNTFNTTAQVYVFTPNASTAVIEAEEVQVTAIVYGPGNPLERIRPVAAFSGALIAAVLLIILRRRRGRS
jgi:ABC-type Fe3+-siderophore transport system permease subunit